MTGVWPGPQYPPVTCGGCGKEVPELEACWGYCGECWNDQPENGDDIDGMVCDCPRCRLT